MKRRIDPQIIKWLTNVIEELPRLTEEEAISLVPMFRSQDSEIRDCAAEILYNTNWKDMENTVQAFKKCAQPYDIDRLSEILSFQEAMYCVENDYDDKLTETIYDENSRLRQADQIISSNI